MKQQWHFAWVVVFALCTLAAWPMAGMSAEMVDAHAEDRKQLLQIFSEIEKGINEQNIDRMVAQMDEKATVIWLNAEASRGHAEIKAYYRRMVGTGDAILNFVNGADVARTSAGVVTPDHSIRVKNAPLILPAPEARKLKGYYSSYRGRGAIPGFIFKNREAAERIKALMFTFDDLVDRKSVV